MQLVAINTNPQRNLSYLSYVVKERNKDGKIEKKILYDKDPVFKFRVSKKGVDFKSPNNYVAMSDTVEVETPYSKLYEAIAKVRKRDDIDLDEAYKRSVRNSLMHDYNVFGADLNLVDWKILEWYDQAGDKAEDFPLKKGFFDIEVDTLNFKGFPEEETAPCPVNFISYLNNEDLKLYVFVLFNKANQSMIDFIRKHNTSDLWSTEDTQWCRDFLEELNARKEDESDKDYERRKRIKDVQILFFQDEVELITSFFATTYEEKPDFLGAWNAYFDLRTIEQRLIKHDLDPKDYMCPPEYKQAYRNVRLIKDEKSMDKADIAHTFDITSYYNSIDLLYYYASIRKGSGKKDSYKLDDILLEEIGEGKYEYEGDIQDAAYVNFEAFLKYSAYDSVRLMELEEKNRDIDLMNMLSKVTTTRVNKVMRKTTSLRNLAYHYLRDKGYALSNNYNQYNELGEQKKFKGAFVADPNLLSPVGILVEGEPVSNIFEDVIDEDLASLYPSIIRAFCIDSNTLIGRITDAEGNDAILSFFGEYMAEGDLIAIGKKIFGLPNVEDILAKYAEEEE